MPINTSLLGELKHESINTRKMIEKVPTEKLDWRPHEKSMTIGKLATHIADLPVWFERIINSDGFDFSNSSLTEKKESTEAILEDFQKRLNEAEQVLINASDEMLTGSWSLSRNGQTLFKLPKMVAIRSLTYNHIYHHRGQLSVFLRLLDIPVPGMYGPSADES